MTDKQHNDQNMDALKKAFERLNEKDDLKPSSWLDALILQKAADAVGAEHKKYINPSSDDSQGASASDDDAQSNVSDLSFRRDRLGSQTGKQKNKGLLPAWAMPVGLAATVLLSFGVVNRVMQSPEFMEPSGVEQSNEVFVDTLSAPEESLTSTSEQEQTELTGEIQKIRAQLDALEQQYQESSAKQASPSEVLSSRQAGLEVEPKRKELISDPSSEEASYKSSDLASDSRDDIGLDEAVASVEVKRDRVVSPEASLSVSEPSPVSVDASVAPDNDRRTAALAPAKMASAIEATEEMTEPALVQEQPVSKAPALSAPSTIPTMSTEPEVAIEQSADQNDEMVGAIMADESNEFSINATENESGDVSSEAVVVSGQKLVSNALKEIRFEDRACLVNQDCALIALDCDSCDCLQAVNSANYDKYRSAFTVNEVMSQCNGMKSDCVLGYCQAKALEAVPE